MGHHAYHNRCSTLRVVIIKACLGAKISTNIQSLLLLLVWIPLLSALTAQLLDTQRQAAEEPLHRLHCCSHTEPGRRHAAHPTQRRRKLVPRTASKAGGITSEQFLRSVKHWQGFLLKCAEKKMELHPKNGRILF